MRPLKEGDPNGYTLEQWLDDIDKSNDKGKISTISAEDIRSFIFIYHSNLGLVIRLLDINLSCVKETSIDSQTSKLPRYHFLRFLSL